MQWLQVNDSVARASL